MVIAFTVITKLPPKLIENKFSLPQKEEEDGIMATVKFGKPVDIIF